MTTSVCQTVDWRSTKRTKIIWQVTKIEATISVAANQPQTVESPSMNRSTGCFRRAGSMAMALCCICGSLSAAGTDPRPPAALVRALSPLG